MDLAGGQTTDEMARMLVENFLKGFERRSASRGAP
jgi:hypothetical protein